MIVHSWACSLVDVARMYVLTTFHCFYNWTAAIVLPSFDLSAHQSGWDCCAKFCVLFFGTYLKKGTWSLNDIKLLHSRPVTLSKIKLKLIICLLDFVGMQIM